MTVNPQETQAQIQETPKSNEAEQNFARLRKMHEQERDQKLAALEEVAQLKKQLYDKDNKKIEQEEDDIESDEPYVDKKVLKKELQKERDRVKKETREEVLAETRKLFEIQKKETYLKQNSDFNNVMSPENLQKFVEKHPGIAEGILSMPDTFERQQLVYQTIKDLKIGQKEEPKQNIQEKIDRNQRSPYYQPSGLNNPPYAGAGDFSVAGQKSAYAKMQELKNRLRLG